MEQTGLWSQLRKRRQAWLDRSSTSQQWAFILLIAFGLWLLLLNSIPLAGDAPRSYDYNSYEYFRRLSYYYECLDRGMPMQGWLLEFSLPFSGAFICFSIATALVSLYAVFMTKTAFVSGVFWSCFSFVYHFIIFTPVAWCDGKIELPKPYLNRSIVFLIVSLVIYWTIYVAFKIFLPCLSKTKDEDLQESNYVFPRLNIMQRLGLLPLFLSFVYLLVIFFLYTKYGRSSERNVYEIIMTIFPFFIPFIMSSYARKSIVKIHSVLEISSLSAMICFVFSLGCASPLFDFVHYQGGYDTSGYAYQGEIAVVAALQLIPLLITSWIFSYKAGKTTVQENPESPTFEKPSASVWRALLGFGGFSIVMLLFALSNFQDLSQNQSPIAFLLMIPIPFAVHYARYCMFRSNNPSRSALFGLLILPVVAIIGIISILLSSDKLIYCVWLSIGVILFLLQFWSMYGLYALAKHNQEKKLTKLSQNVLSVG